MLYVFSAIFIVGFLFIFGMWFGMSIYEADEEIQKEKMNEQRKNS